jgi:hypothetical protein
VCGSEIRHLYYECTRLCDEKKNACKNKLFKPTISTTTQSDADDAINY